MGARMSPQVLRAFEEILREETIAGPVLEVGAVPGADCLLRLPSLSGVTGKVGINLDPFSDDGDVRMVCGNANGMSMFADGSFGCVLCNSTLEHDARFWLTLAEIRRVTAPGGLVVIGVPGFRGMGPGSIVPRKSLLGWAVAMLARLTHHDALLAGTVTLGVHNYPGDYYRFTEQAVRELFLEGLVQQRCRWVMTPPRIIGWARKPVATAT